MKRFGDDEFIILLLYVDDMLLVGKDVGKINKFKRDLSKSFYMKDLGIARTILGIEIKRDIKSRKLWLSQERYIEQEIERFNMKYSKQVGTPFVGHSQVEFKSKSF